MDTKDAQTTLERLESPEGLNLVQRATKTFLVLRALRGHIDQADASLTRLATERDCPRVGYLLARVDAAMQLSDTDCVVP